MKTRHGQRGQTLTVVALALVPLLLIAGLVIDGGWAFSQQRRTQNAMDAAANAGAVQLVQNLPFRLKGQTQPITDQAVLDQITATANANGVPANPGDPVPTAVYTDILGHPLNPAVVVGSLGAAPPPATAYGVKVSGTISFSTFFAGIAGMTGFRASADATAVAGALAGLCASDQPCGFLPLTFPNQLTDCDNTGKIGVWGSGGAYQPVTNPNGSNEEIIGICGQTAGSVGWLDILPHNPNCSGSGASYLACDILNPQNEAFNLPVWIHTQTGNINSSQVQNALNTLSGNIVGTYEPGLDKTVFIPLYDCLDNNVGQLSPGPACPTPPVSSVGNLTYYHITGIAAFILDHSYITGSNSECQSAPGSPYVDGNGSNGCIKGWVTQVVTQGQVGVPTDPNNTVWGIQLVQ